MELCIQEKIKEKHKQELQALQVNNMGYCQFCVLEYRCIEVNDECFLKGVYHDIVVIARGNERMKEADGYTNLCICHYHLTNTAPT